MGRCRSGQGTFAGTSGNDEDAPTAVARGKEGITVVEHGHCRQPMPVAADD
jgi:hypothetical protein